LNETSVFTRPNAPSDVEHLTGVDKQKPLLTQFITKVCPVAAEKPRLVVSCVVET